MYLINAHSGINDVALNEVLTDCACVVHICEYKEELTPASVVSQATAGLATGRLESCVFVIIKLSE